jgi:hypothetical protein
VKQINLERLQDLILARISAGGKKPPTTTDLTTALYPMVTRHWTQAEWREQLEQVVASLRAAGMIEPDDEHPAARSRPPARRGRAERPKRRQKPSARRSAGLAITAAGKARVKTALGLKPSESIQDARRFNIKYLPKFALEELAGPGAGTVSPSVAVLARRLGVVPKPASKGKRQGKLETELNRVVDAWLCASLGVPEKKKMTLGDLRAALLARELDIAVRKPQAVARIAAATLSGAARGGDAAVTQALTARWLFDEPLTAAENVAPESRRARRDAQGTTAPAAAPVERIAAKALQAADGPGAHQFGDNKVFIGSVWRALADDPEIGRLGEATFKRQLAEAHRRGLLKLGRADLVAAMDPSEVSASEIKHQNATYHFILRGASA